MGILDRGLVLVIGSEKEAPNTKLIPKTQSSNQDNEHAAYCSTVRTSWYELTLMDA